MRKPLTNNAYIDGANLHKGVGELGWKLNYKSFRIWLTEKYGVKEAYLFLGLIPKYKDMYTRLQECGFTLVFKEVVYDGAGKPKGNCDADLVLRVTQDAYEKSFECGVIVASDGDYAGLVKFLLERTQFETIVSPAPERKCSILLKRTGAPIAYLDDQRNILA